MNRTHTKESFSTDLQKALELFSGEELSKVLHEMEKSLADSSIISEDNILSMLMSFRETQDYNAMITLVDELNTNLTLNFSCTPSINHLYAFALNRRNQNTDREIAEKVIKSVIEDKENSNPNFLCLYGRICKDKFIDSDYTDMESLDNAIFWYRRCFEVQPNEYAGINLATLLVAKGNDFSTCPEIHKVALTVNTKISEKGNLEALTDYWDVATVFEISLLSKNYAKAIIAADCMFRLKPAIWCLKSTVGNTKIINHSKQVPEELQSPEEIVLNLWMDFFTRATEKINKHTSRFPVLVVASPDVYMPSYISASVEIKSCDVSSLCVEKMKGTCSDCHEHRYSADCIKNISINESDESLLQLCLHQNSQKLSVVFPSVHDCKIFYLQIQAIFPDVWNTNF